jgi:hypothetical protein
MKRPLLNRRDVIFVIIVAAGISTLLSVLTEKPSGRMLAFNAVLNAMEGLMIAAVVAAVFRFVERGRRASERSQRPPLAPLAPH